ncbi:hypothetical protein [Sphingopyxis sp. JAI128]|uniref:hypothetical protein n=1 Tax=Sphingopyxis sp. JAI128 TaxID=2723066 RepID=UPI0016081F64|nr:hypothetical protein [Sphingopyxis sp. JAI128]MBB6424971.1 putative DNA-binding protein (UPF0251 family) [Sphingopyxis sp. JAI128]
MIVRNHQSEARRPLKPLVPAAVPKERVQRRWSEYEIMQLKDYLAQGYRFSRIAKKLGRSRNSVIGYAWRNCR